METVFLTGGTGFVGANLIRLLLEKGFYVRALARPGGNRGNLAGLPVEIIEGDLLDEEALRRGCTGARHVYHVAADYRIWVTNPADMYAANVQGTVNVLTAAGKAGVERIVHCSSVAAVRLSSERRSMNEDSVYGSPEEMISDYKKSKFLSERAAFDLAAKGLPIVIVNPAAPIGPYDIKPTPTGRIVVDFLNGRIPSYIDTGLNVVHVQDVALGHYLAALKGRPGQRYILGGENLTLKGMLDLLSEVTGLPGPRFKTPYPVAYLFSILDTARARAMGVEPLAPLDAVKMAKYYMWFDSTKAIEELGYPRSNARTALKDAAAWFAKNGYAKKAVPAFA